MGTNQRALEQARAARTPEDRLGFLIDAWQTHRDPKLAELIEQHLEALTAQRPAVGSASASFQQAWLGRAAKRDPADLGHLLASIARGTGPHCQARIEALAAFGPNPVIAKVLTGWLSDAPFDGKNRARCLGPALEILEACGDPRSVPALAKAVANRATTVRVVGLKNWGALKALADSAAKWARPRPVSLEGLDAPGREHRADLQALWRDVYAAPDELQRRQVLADALQEQGDPRGEFMSLQLARAPGATPSKRERELLAQYREAWMGPLAAALRTPEYEGGLLIGASVKVSVREPAKVVADDAWRAVRRLDFQPSMEVIEALVGNPRAKRLESLSGLAGRVIVELLEAGPERSWTLLEFKWAGVEQLGALLEAQERKLPALRALGVLSSSLGPGFLGRPLGSRLTRLGVHGDEGFAALCLEARKAPGLERLAVERNGLSACVDLKANTMRVFHEWSSGGPFEAPRGLSHIELVVAKKGDPALLRALKALAPVSVSKGQRPSLLELLREGGT